MGPNHTGKREDVDPRRTALLQSVRARFHRGAGGIDIVDQQDRLSHDFGASAQGERALYVPVPGPTREAALTWRIAEQAQGIFLVGIMCLCFKFLFFCFKFPLPFIFFIQFAATMLGRLKQKTFSRSWLAYNGNNMQELWQDIFETEVAVLEEKQKIRELLALLALSYAPLSPRELYSSLVVEEQRSFWQCDVGHR